MSYEGTVQVLCESGHEFQYDCHQWDDIDITNWRCNLCQGAFAWDNPVDETNGSHDEEGNRIDGYYHFKEKTPTQTCVCNKCQRIHVAKAATYEIPKGRRCPCDECTRSRENIEMHNRREHGLL